MTMMKRIGLLVLFVTAQASAASTIEDLPFAATAATLGPEMVFAKYESGACHLETANERGIALRWIPEEKALERTTYAAFDKDANGKLEHADPSWGGEFVIRTQTVDKVVPVKVADQGDVAVYAYREANAVVLVVPGKSGQVVTSGQQEDGCRSMATIALSTKPASECKTTLGCGRLAQAGNGQYVVTAGVSAGSVSATIRILTASK